MATYKKTMGLADLTLFTVSAIILLDTLAATASIGASSIAWWGILAILFALPIGLITAEMGTTYPAQGGLYVWVRQAFGPRWAARAAWAYWINTAVWLPSIYVFFSGFASRLFGLDLDLATQISVSIALVWLSVVVNCIGLEFGKWVPNLGALFKVVIFLTIIVGGFLFARANGASTELTAAALTPSWSEGLKYLPAVIYGMLGFELVCAGGAEIDNPRRDLPRAILLSGVVIIGFYALSTAALLLVLPPGEINIVEGLIDYLQLLFGDGDIARMAILVLGTAALFTFFSNGVTWALGCNRASAEAAREGQLPRFFGILNRQHGAPVGAAIAMGVVCTIALIVYGRAATTNEDLFWDLFGFSAVIFFMPYIGLALAFWKMRRTDPDTPRAFRAPFGRVLTILCVGCLAAATALLLYVPGEGFDWLIIGGVVAALALGEALIGLARLEQRRKR